MRTKIQDLRGDITAKIKPNSTCVAIVVSYKKPDTAILGEDGNPTGETTNRITSDETTAILNLVKTSCEAQGIEFEWAATPFDVPNVALEDGETLIVEASGALVKNSPDPTPEPEIDETEAN